MTKTIVFSMGILMLLLVACTGQKPASIKNSTTSKHPVSASCSSLVFEGEVLTKENIQKILICTGWNKRYPHLSTQLALADSAKLGILFKTLNQRLFTTKLARKQFFSLMTRAQDNGSLQQLSLMLEKTIGNHQLLSQLDNLVGMSFENDSDRKLMQVLSKDNNINIKNISALSKIVGAYENHREELNKILDLDEDEKFHLRLITMADDMTKMSSKNWSYLAQIISNEEKPLKTWAQVGIQEDVQPLLRVLENPLFLKDIKFLNKSLTDGIICDNSASSEKFHINVKQELKHKIESLKYDSPEIFEQTMLHGLNKCIAFQEFCGEDKTPQGLKSFSHILNYAFDIIPSTHDFIFLQKMHRIFGEDRFVLLDFLSSANFTQWNELLALLKNGSADVGLVKTLYSALNEMSDEDLQTVAEWVSEIQYPDSQTSQWVKAWSSIWNRLTLDEKKQFIDLLTVLSEDESSLASVLVLSNDFLKLFPEFTQDLSLSLASPGLQESLSHFLKIFKEQQAQEEMAQFLSDDGIFEFIKILTQNHGQASRPISLAPLAPVYVERPSLQRQASLTRTCFEYLQISHETNSSYYMLVNELPEACLSTLGKVGFVGRIYLWMNTSNKFFNEGYGITDFHSSAGVWSPPMLHFIFTAAIKADTTIQSSSGKGILNNIDAIHATVTSPQVLESFHLMSLVFTDVAQTIPFDMRVENFFNKMQDGELNEFSTSFFSLISQSSTSSYVVSSKPTSCKDLDSQLGANPCLSSTAITDKTIEILRILARSNENGQSLIKELVRWLHPNGGIDLPFLKKKTYSYHISFDEIIRFAYDLSSESTRQEFIFNNGTESRKVTGTTIDRLEVVIREISFSNNFYGAYFKNDAAGFKNYRQEMLKAKKLLKWLDRLSGVFRKTGTLPQDSSWRLDNVRNTFGSLVEVSDNYPQAEGGTKSYGSFIQSLLAAVATSSQVSSQDFNAYRIPKPSLADGHNGMFLTKMVEISGLRHLSRFVRSRFGDLSVLKSEDFLKVNKNLIGRHSLGNLQNSLQSLLDQYLDHDRNQMNLLISDLVNYLSELNPADQKKIESSMLKFIMILSDEEISTSQITKGAKAIELIVKRWPEIREILIEVNEPKLLIDYLDSLSSKVINDKKGPGIFSQLMDSEIVNLDEIDFLLQKESFRKKLGKFIKHFLNSEMDGHGVNWQETLKAILASPDLRWGPIKQWLHHSVANSRTNLTLSLLIQVLGEKSGTDYRLKTIMDELFINHRKDLNQFLLETFPSLELYSE